MGAIARRDFVITAASEIMAILALAKDRMDLRARLAADHCGREPEGRGSDGRRSWVRSGR